MAWFSIDAAAVVVVVVVVVVVFADVVVDVVVVAGDVVVADACLLYTSPSPRDGLLSRMPSSA